MVTLRDRSGETVRAGDTPLQLGRLIKSGGAGSVYLLPQQPRNVAKLYHDSTPPEAYDRKVEAMLSLTPDLPPREEHGQRYVQIAWPNASVHDARGRFLGFTMPLLDIAATAELEPVLQERQARTDGLPTGLGAKMTLAANLSTVIGSLHRQQHYVVDLKPVNLRFYRQSLYIALLDCDGFSINDGQGQRHRASQFTPDYLAPEWQARGITADGELAQDLFALAVVIFQLLNFGIHPFTGKPASERVPTDIPGRIRGGFYAYGRRANPAMAPSPVSGHALMPDELRSMFDRAFTSRNRPGAEEWSRMLARYARRDSGLLVNCHRNAEHQHFAGMECAACARAQLLDHARRQPAQRPRVRRAHLAQPLRTATGTRTGAGTQTITYTTAPARRTGGCLIVIIIAALIGWLVLGHGPRRPTVSRTPARTTAPTVRPQPSPVAEVQPVPASQRPDPAQVTAATVQVLEAVKRGDATGYTHAMQGFDGGRHRAQPGSLRKYYEQLIRKANRPELQLAARDAAYRQIIDDDPYASFAAIELGVHRLLLNDSADARNLFALAIWSDPTNARAWYGLGTSYLGQDRDLAAAAMAVADLHFADEREASAIRSIFQMTMRLRSDEISQQQLDATTRARELAAALGGRPAQADGSR